MIPAVPSHEAVGAVIVDRISSDGLVPLFGSNDVDELERVAKAVAAAGLSTLEVTLRSAGTLDALSELAARVEGAGLQLTLGAGTVLDATTAEAAVAAGARFVFSPMLSASIAARCLQLGVPYFPGCATPTEIHGALSLGCGLVKLFPAETIGGPAFLRSVRAVFPGLRAIPTGGIAADPEPLSRWFEAGAIAVGLGSSLFPARLATAGARGELQREVDRAVVAVARAREGSRP